jgi:hypothetical protein
MPTGTIRLHRVLRSIPDKACRAFSSSDAVGKLLPPYGFTCRVHHVDFRVGGTFKMSFEIFATGQITRSVGSIDKIPGMLLRYKDKYGDPSLPREMHVTVSSKRVPSATELSVLERESPRRFRSTYAISAGKSRPHSPLTWSSRRMPVEILLKRGDELARAC